MVATLRVLVVNPGNAVWGAELYLLGQVQALSERGIEITLASPEESPFATMWQERGLPLVPMPLQQVGGLRAGDTDARPGAVALARDAARVAGHVRAIAVAAKRFDVLHSYSLNTHMDVAVAGRMSRTPVVLDLVNIVRPGVGRKVLSAAAAMADITVANSTATAQAVTGRGKVQIIHPGIDLDKFAPGPLDVDLRETLATRPHDPLVGIFGRLDEPKGVHVLVDAMAALSGRAAKANLVVVGERGTGPQEYTDRLMQTAKEKLGDRVKFIGRRSDVAKILRCIDIAVNASEAEPFGLNVLEAQAVGTPVIGTDAGGIPEFVEHGVSGLLVTPNGVEPLALAIERLVDDPRLGTRMAKVAMGRVRPGRGLAAQYDELAQVYRGLVGASAATAGL